MAHFANGCMLALSLTSSVAFADFLPPNDLAKEDGLLRAGSTTEADFNEVIDAAEAYYKPLISSRYKAKLVVNRLWKNSTVNAAAMRSGSEWRVEMYGGLARRPEISKDGFGLVLCHEIGHHLAGYPYVPGGGLAIFGNRNWAANEGQSDYFASQACARQLWKDDSALNASYRAEVATLPKAACDQVWNSTADQNLCYRVMTAAEGLAAFSSSTANKRADWNTPSTKVVFKTENSHPDGQCRLDTYAAGALCERAFDDDLIPGVNLGRDRNSPDAEKEASRSSCMRYENFTVGLRPSCWFKSLIDS